MADLMTKAIEDWHETEAHNLKPGSRFCLSGALGEVFTVIDIYEQYSLDPVEKVEKLFIETASQDFRFDSSDVVLVIPNDEQAIVLSEAKS